MQRFDKRSKVFMSESKHQRSMQLLCCQSLVSSYRFYLRFILTLFRVCFRFYERYSEITFYSWMPHISRRSLFGRETCVVMINDILSPNCCNISSWNYHITARTAANSLYAATLFSRELGRSLEWQVTSCVTTLNTAGRRCLRNIASQWTLQNNTHAHAITVVKR